MIEDFPSHSMFGFQANKIERWKIKENKRKLKFLLKNFKMRDQSLFLHSFSSSPPKNPRTKRFYIINSKT